ncbi:carboxypeptidase-like regulatory domain-containing protein [Flavobacterium sp. UBA7680]|uniref:carboxypeptidase-like regulatory domain-containing protein n=1 Tax=Flavobacterium sp. UBA7680 TaxID=1946559 RepID=UPI0025BD15C5|nr:carboxypeptidase-like regulatory domain-containing protein [Flavobacterium sp. UBA7680]
MKNKLFFLILLLCSCAGKDELNGYIYDYDTERPIKNVHINIKGDTTQTDSTGYFSIKVKSNSPYTIFLEREGYASKKIYRKPDSLGKFKKQSLKNNSIYLINKESEFSNKINN